MLLNCHIGHFVLGSLCVRDLVRLGLSGIRAATRIPLKPETSTEICEPLYRFVTTDIADIWRVF